MLPVGVRTGRAHQPDGGNRTKSGRIKVIKPKNKDDDKNEDENDSPNPTKSNFGEVDFAGLK